MTNTTTTADRQPDDTVVIYSARQADLSGDGAGFWSNGSGWTVLEAATKFTAEQSRIFGLPLGAHPDVCWLVSTDAERIALAHQIKTELRNDGYDVARAPDGRFYWGDEQDREDVTCGEYLVENQAWRDLARARSHVLEDAGLEYKGVFTSAVSSGQMALQCDHLSRDANTTLHTAVLDEGVYQLRVCGRGADAYFEWVDQLGDPVGDVLSEIDFDQVEATLAPDDRDTSNARMA